MLTRTNMAKIILILVRTDPTIILLRFRLGNKLHKIKESTILDYDFSAVASILF